MTDLFTAEQGKRLFGFIAVGGSLGAILGPLVPTFPASIELSTGIFCLIISGDVRNRGAMHAFFPAEFPEHAEAATAEKPIGGNIWDSVTHIVRSSLLVRAQSVFIFIYTLHKYMGLFSTGGPHRA